MSSDENIPDDELSKSKKPRGRPTSKKSIASAMVKGIMTQPIGKDTCCELVSNQPQTFKKLPDILKSFNQLKCWIKLLPDKMEINFRDHLRKSYNKLYMPGNAMVSYYLDPDAPIAWISHTEDKQRPDAMYLCCARENLLEICKDVGDDFQDFRIIVKKSEKKWYISIADKHGCTEINEVPRPLNMGYSPPAGSPESETEAFNFNSDKDYSLFFDISADKLKNIVTRANGANITFSKMPNSKNIKIESAPPNGVSFWNVFDNPTKINLVQKVPDESYLVSSINSDHIKIAANTSIQFMKTVRIGMDTNKPMSFKWFALDNDNRETCVLHTYVDIVK